MPKNNSRKKQLKKLGQVKLTEEEKILIAENINSPFFKLLADKILPSRVQQISVTCVSAAQTQDDLWYYKGMVYEADWLPRYLRGEIEHVDEVDYTNPEGEEGEIAAEDDTEV